MPRRASSGSNLKRMAHVVMDNEPKRGSLGMSTVVRVLTRDVSHAAPNRGALYGRRDRSPFD